MKGQIIECAEESCTNSSQNSTLKFYHFPRVGTTNLKRCRLWAEFAFPGPDWSSAEALQKLYTTHKHLCAFHFKDDCFLELNPGALTRYCIPTIKSSSGVLERNVHSTSNSVDQLPPASSSRADVDDTTEPVLKSARSEATRITSCASRKATEVSAAANAAASVMEVDAPGCEEIGTNEVPETNGTLNAQTPSRKRNATTCFETDTTPSKQGKKPPSSASTQTPEAKSIMSPSSTTIQTPKIGETVKKRLQSGPRSLLQDLKVSKVTQLTPRKQMLIQSHRKRQREITRLRKEYKALKDKTKSENILSMEVFKKVPPALKLLMESTMRVAQQSPKGRRWKLDEKIQALTLYKSSPKNYALLQRMFPLPSTRTLRALLGKIPFGSGVNHSILAAVQKSLQNLHELDKYCALVFDEMSLRRQLMYNRKLDRIDGFQDHKGQGVSGKPADHALVFMIQGLRKNFKQPIAYYLSHNTTSGERLAIFIKQVIRGAHDYGVRIIATGCDMGGNNGKALRKLGATPEDPVFYVDDDWEVFTVFDVPHLLKCTRNNLMTKDLHFTAEFDGKPEKGTASWKNIADVVLEDRKTVYQRLGHIKDEHLDPKGARKMKVNVAAQIFSHTMASQIETQMLYGVLKNDVKAKFSAFLCHAVDSMFDSTNGRGQYPYKGKVLRTRIEAGSPHIEFYKKSELFVRTWQFEGHTDKNAPPSQKGWIISFRAIRFIWQKLHKLGFKYLEPRKLNQDCLENCFGCVRANCGGNHNPNCGQFLGGLKTVVINNFAYVDLKGSNCEYDNVALLTDLRALLEAEVEGPPVDKVAELLTDLELLHEDKEMAPLQFSKPVNENEKCTVAYIAGSVLKRYLKKIKCNACNEILITKDLTPDHEWIKHKEYNKEKPSLIYPTKIVIETVGEALFFVEAFLNKKPYIRNLMKIIVTELENTVDFSWVLRGCPNKVHQQYITKFLCEGAFFVNVKWWCRRKNRQFIDEAKAQKAKKAKAVGEMSTKMKVLKHI